MVPAWLQAVEMQWKETANEPLQRQTAGEELVNVDGNGSTVDVVDSVKLCTFRSGSGRRRRSVGFLTLTTKERKKRVPADAEYHHYYGL